MRPVVGAIALGALVVGGAVVLATSRHSSSAQAQAPAPMAATAAPAQTPVQPTAFANGPAAQPYAPVAQTVTTRAPRRNSVGYRQAPTYTQTRSTKGSVEIIGGSAIGGAVVGALVGGKKGALIGGLVGGTAGTVYDRTTRHKVVRRQ